MFNASLGICQCSKKKKKDFMGEKQNQGIFFETKLICQEALVSNVFVFK